MQAAKYGQVEIVRLLMKYPNLDVNKTDAVFDDNLEPKAAY
jgi:hypothetical protein